MKTVSKLLRIVLKLFLSLVLGVVISFGLIKNDAVVRQAFTCRITPFFSYLLSSDVSFSMRNISLFPPKIELGNVFARPHKDDEWFWSSSSLSIGCSWFDFLLYGTIALQIELKGFETQTLLANNGLSVWGNISKLFEGVSHIPTFLQSLSMIDAQAQIEEPYTDTIVTANFSLEARKFGNELKGTIFFDGSSGKVHGCTVVENLTGSVRFDVLSQSNSSRLKISTNCSVDVPHMGEGRSCHLSGLWRYDHGLFSLKNDERSFVVGPIKLYFVGSSLFCELGAHFPASYMYRMLSSRCGSTAISGQCSLNMSIDFEDGPSVIRGELTSGSIDYAKKNVFSTSKLSFNRNQNAWSGMLCAQTCGGQTISGVCNWDEERATGALDLCNDDPINLPGSSYWCFLPNGLTAHLARHRDGCIDGLFKCIATHQRVGSEFVCTGTTKWNNNNLDMRGVIDEKPFYVSCSTRPDFRLHHCTYRDEHGKHLVEVRAHKQSAERFIGTVSFPFIKELLRKVADIDLQGQGTVEVCGAVKDNTMLAQVKLLDGTVRLPHTYNFINAFQGQFIIDPRVRSIVMRDMTCSLHRGVFDCKRACALFDHNYALTFAHAPVLFHDCLFNWKKDLFAVVSGRLLFKKERGDNPLLRGQLFIDRAQLKRNIFSEDFQHSFFSSPHALFEQGISDVSLALNVATKEPVRIKTAFLETSAKINLSVSGSALHPDMSGRISLMSGFLAFPYKPLHLTKGLIDFVPGKLSDPTIEISAKNKLKKYNVSLDVSGSLQRQRILLEASPPLTEEQIIALLLVGSEQGSLNILMPALIMQNIKGIIFGSDQSPTGIRTAFGRLFQPLERVHLVPSFTDQTGRGGLRGALEIDVSERWRAMIQQNFSLTEDTRVEIEYLLSDDISLRCLRDERGDISSEVEMRWKF